MSSADEEDKDHGDAGGPPSAEEISDPALQAEIDNPADANPPTGEEAAPGAGTTAADRGPLPATGAPEELTSDQTPPQGEERGDAVPAEPLAGGEAPAGGEGATAAPPEASDGRPEPAVVAEQPPPTPSAVASEGAAVAEAETDKAAQAERAAEAGRAGVLARAGVPPAPDGAGPGEEAAPGEVDQAREALIERLRSSLGDAVVGTHIVPGVDAWARVRLGAWDTAARVCRDELGLTYFCYLSAIDWMPSPYGRSEDDGGDGTEPDEGPAVPAALEHGYAGGESRFQLLARLVSPTSHLGLTLKADLDDADPRAPTWVDIFSGADWHEREAWEMYGIHFAGHPNLRHLYLPGAFEGHPLRKDFPLLAREVKPWPGLVDVEAMPGEADAAGEEAP